MGVKYEVTKGYDHRTNMVTDRFNRTLEEILRKTVAVANQWDQVLPFVVFSYNITPHTTTGKAPFTVIHGADPKFPPLERE